MAAGVSALFGLFALRTRGSYFLMITLALGQVLWGIAFGWRSLTGGDDGLPSVPRPRLPLPWSLTEGVPFYYFVLVCFALAIGLLTLVVRSSVSARASGAWRCSATTCGATSTSRSSWLASSPGSPATSSSTSTAS